MKRKSNTSTDANKSRRAKAGLKRQRLGGGDKKAAAAAAREWQTTFDATNDAIWVLDKEQRVVRSNKMAEQVLQRPSQEFIGKHCWEIMHATTGSVAECPLQRTRKNLRRESMELQVGERWIKVTCDPILDAAGRYDGAVHIIADITASKRAEKAREAMLQRQQGINQLQQSLLAPATLEDKLKRITDGIVQLFEADFCRIWVIKSGDLCKDGCVHAETKKGPHACRLRKQCLHLMASSSRCTHIDGKDNRRVPLSAHNIGLIASGEEHKFLTNDVSNDPRVHNHGWARELGLVSFAGYQLRIPAGEALGVLALFAKHPILPAEDAALDGLSNSIAQVIQQAKAEEALRESEANLQLSFDAGRLGHWSWDIITGEVKWSDQCKALYGQPPDVVMSYDLFLRSVHPDDREMAKTALKKAIETRTDCDFEKRIIWPDGSVHWTATRARVFCDAAGIVVRMSGVVFNIDERKQMEKKLEASERMFRSVVENSHTGIYISDDAFLFTYVNDELCTLLGYSREELVGSDVRRNVSEKDMAVVEDRYLRRQKGEAVPSWYEIGLVKKDGSKLFVMSSAFTIREPSGRVKTIGQVLDITERRRMEKTLQSTQDLLNDVGRIAQVGGWKMDMIAQKATWTLGIYDIMETAPGEPIPRPDDHLNYYLPEYQPLAAEAMRALVEGDKPVDYEAQLRTAKGNVKWCHVMGRAIHEGGKVVEIYGTLQDITERKRAEETMERERNLLRTLIDNIPDAIYVRDTANRFVLANETVARRMGVASPADLIGKTDADFYPPEQAAHFAAADREVFAGRTLVNFEEDVVHLDGKRRFILGTKVPLKNAQGEVTALVGIGRDITERKKAEEELERERNLLRTLIDQIPDSIYVRDAANRFVLANETVARRMGAASSADLIGKTDADYYSAEQAALFAAADREVLAGHALVNFEEDITHLDGTRRFILSTKVPLRDAQGAVTALIGVGRDITERKQAQEALETSEKRFRDIAEHGQHCIWEVDAEGRYTYVSQAVKEIMGYRSEEVLQKHFYDFSHPDDRESLKATALSMFAAKEPFRQLINRNVHKNGQTVWLATSGLPLLDEKGNLLGYRGVGTDITRRKQAEEALQESRRALFTLMSNLPGMAYRCRNDRNWTMEFVSQGALALTGYTADELMQSVQISFAQIIHPDDRKAVWDTVQAALQTRQPFQLVYRIVTATGVENWVWEKGQGVFSEQGELLALEGFITDITERTRAEEALRESEEKFRLATSTARDAIIMLDNEEKVAFWNRAAEEMFGYSGGEALGQNVHALLAPERYRKAIAKGYGAFRVSGRGAVVGKTLELSARRKDGTEIPVELSLSATQLKGQWHALAILRDITERKRTEEALATSEKRFRDIADHAQEWIWELNAEGRFTYASQAVEKVLGYTPEEMVQKHFEDFFLPEDRETFKAMAGEAFTRKQPFREFVNRNVHKNGQVVWLLSSGFPMLDDKGNLLGYRGVDMDITERKRAEEALLLKDSALTSSANAVVINGIDGRTIYFNDSFLVMCGYTREEASQLTTFDLYAQEDSQRAFTELSTQGYFIGEGVAKHKDGSTFPVAISASTIKDANGRPISTMSSFVDISTRKKAEAELRASEGRFRSLFDNMAEGVALHETVYDEHGVAVNYRLLDVNRQYEAMIDLKRDQVVGKLATEVYKSEVAPFLKECAQVGETGRPYHFETYHAPIKKQLDISVAPLGPGRWATIFSDNTERKRAEHLLRLNAERVQVLLKLNQMTDATLQQITDFALEEAVRITRSQMGYLAFVNHDETVLTIHSWSKQAMKECTVINKPIDYVLSETGLWGEAVRQRRPMITNDYAAPHPAKKGHPAGHVPVHRHMNVPIFAGKHIVLVAGVGNKEDEYDNTDVEQLTLLMEGMWRLIERLRTEEVLRESELFLKETQSIGRIGGWKANLETGCVEGTEGVYRIFEVPLGYKLGLDEALTFVMPEYAPIMRERMQQTMTTGQPFQMECEIVTGTGKHLWIEMRGRIAGAAPHLMGTFQDITARKQAEEALRQSELFLREAQSIGRIGGWKANPETGYTEWTEGIYHMFEVSLDYKPEFEGGLKFFLPQYIPIIRERMQRTMTTGEPFQMECEVVTATGKHLQGELRGLPHHSTTGKASCVMGTFQDITKRKQAEEALRESELFLRETQSIARIGGWKANPETDYLDWTEGIYRMIEAPLDYKPGFSEGLKFYLPQYIPIMREHVQRTLTTGEPFQMECEVVTTTGRHLWTELRGLAQGIAGKSLYVMGTLQDITERRRVEEALRENELFLREAQSIGRIGGWKANPETDYLECTEGIYSIIGVPLDYKPGFSEALKFFMPQYVPVIRERLMRTLTAGEPFQMECEITTAAGKHLWTELRGLAQGIAGKTLCVTGTLQDITERKRAEEVLRQSEESLRQILESVGFGVVIVGRDKKVRQANHAALEMIGLSAEEELKGRVCHETLCPADCDKCPILDLGQKLDKSERVLVQKNGNRIPILKSVTSITLDGEEVLLESFVDITERKQAEEALRAQRRQLTDIIEFLPDATLAIDKEGRVIIWNKAIEEMTGIPAAEMLGKAGYTHATAFYGEARPQLVDLALKNHEDILARYPRITHEGDALATEVFCTSLHNKKGAWVFAKASPLHDQSGNIVGAIESVRDITRRKQAEEELQFRNVLLLTQQEASIEGSLVVDEESRILSYNRRFVEMWGIPAKLLEGGNDEQVLQFVTSQLADPGAFYQRVQYLYEHRQETARDELILADGRVFDRYSTPMFGPGDRYYGRVWYFRDITERKRAEQELGRLNADLAHKNRELQNILFAASHDLRSPLLNIHGFGKRLEDACTELRKVVDQPDAGAAELQKVAPLIREAMPKALGFIRSGAARMDTLISGMLRLSRLGRVEMRIELLDISKVVTEVVNSMASEIQSAGGAVQAVSLPACHGDAVLISQVFANLIENAIKYRDPARPIRVEVSGHVKDADVVYCVADNGIGIATADQERIWNLFCRLNPTATEGEGLGLNLVRRIVERHNGRVWVESALGIGSKFFVSLPVEKTVAS